MARKQHLVGIPGHCRQEEQAAEWNTLLGSALYLSDSCCVTPRQRRRSLLVRAHSGPQLVSGCEAWVFVPRQGSCVMCVPRAASNDNTSSSLHRVLSLPSFIPPTQQPTMH
jgi:hypothetical protein